MEWPTLRVLLLTYAVWGLGTTIAADLSVPMGIVLTALAITQFSSLQHEALHGHPFRAVWMNEVMVFPALTLVTPYRRFRDLHLAHHHDEVLTDPYDDPESNYLDPLVWARLSQPVKWILRANNTLAGRILLGPLIGTGEFLRGEAAALSRGDAGVRRGWALHLAGSVPLVLWLGLVGSMPVWAYCSAAYLGLGVLKIRSFCEHKAHARASGRSVIIEDRGPLALLFLNNNLHVVHHMHPAVPWYRLPAVYLGNREHYVLRNGGYVFGSYGEVFRRHFLRAKDPVPHPLGREAAGS